MMTYPFNNCLMWTYQFKMKLQPTVVSSSITTSPLWWTKMRAWRHWPHPYRRAKA